MRTSSWAIRQGDKMKSTHPVWIALFGIPEKRAELSSWAKMMPPASLRICTPLAPSEPVPERMTPMAFGPRSASESKRDFAVIARGFQAAIFN